MGNFGGPIQKQLKSNILYKTQPITHFGTNKRQKQKKKVKSEKNFGFENDESLEWMDLRTLLKIGFEDPPKNRVY